jgi:hypothetical protein
MPIHKVVPGDCIHSIADANGLFWETLWNDSENSMLRQNRETPGVLRSGDEVFVPELRGQAISGGTESRHTFRRKGVPVTLRLIVTHTISNDEESPSELDDVDPNALDMVDEDGEPEIEPEEPWQYVEYVLRYEGKDVRGTTDGDGAVIIGLPPSVTNAELIVAPGTPEEMLIPIDIGGLDPIDSTKGTKQRLRNLGFGISSIDDEEEDLEMHNAIRAFQAERDLDSTGELTDETRDALKDAHGS